MNGLWTSYRCLTIQDDNDLQYVVAYAKKYEPLIQFELMAFIREYKTTSDIPWEYLEKQLNDSLDIDNPEHAEYGLHAWGVSLQMDHHLYASLQMDEAAPQVAYMHA
ncbi:hypothetical protein ACSQ67_024260 [Phaseolus vulgaris]